MGIQEFTFCPYRAGEHSRGRGDRDEGLPHDRSGHHRIPARQTGKGRTLLRLGAAHGGPGRCHAPPHEAVPRRGCENKVAYALDCASSEVYDAETQTYYMNGRQISRDEMIDFGRRMSEQYKFLYIEDLLNENDWEGYTQASKAIDKTILIGDDFIVTNVERLKRAYQEKRRSAASSSSPIKSARSPRVWRRTITPRRTA